jgi:hypothetical protein
MAAPLAVHASPNQSNPVLRGKWVRESLLCQELPPPPPNVNTSLPPVDPKVTTRERFRQHRQDAACRGCHELLDPVGLAFENYDLVGRWRTMDGVNPVDATGEIVGGEGALAGPFSGALALGAKLVPSEALRQCVSRQWMTFALGRALVPEDDCSRDRAAAALAGPGGNVRELVVAVARSDAFRFGQVAP